MSLYTYSRCRKNVYEIFNLSQNIISIIVHQISKHELVTSVGGLHVLMLTDCKYVDL